MIEIETIETKYQLFIKLQTLLKQRQNINWELIHQVANLIGTEIKYQLGADSSSWLKLSNNRSRNKIIEKKYQLEADLSSSKLGWNRDKISIGSWFIKLQTWLK